MIKSFGETWVALSPNLHATFLTEDPLTSDAHNLDAKAEVADCDEISLGEGSRRSSALKVDAMFA